MKIAIATNAGEQAALLKQETQEFQKEQRKKVREAGGLIRKEAKSILASGSPLKVGKRNSMRRKKGVGPLRSRVSLKLVTEGGNAVAVIVGPAPAGFYGRFHETGINATVYIARSGARFSHQPGRAVGSQVKLASRFGGGHGRKETLVSSYVLRLPKRVWLITAAERKEQQAVALVGDSFKVFQNAQVIAPPRLVR